MVNRPPRVAPPWTFTLISCTVLGLALSLGLVVRTAMARSADRNARQEMIRDLERFLDAQEAFQDRAGRYAPAIGTTGDSTTLAFGARPGVVLQYRPAGPAAWSMVATHTTPLVAPTQCGLFVGDPSLAPHRAVTAPGRVACW